MDATLVSALLVCALIFAIFIGAGNPAGVRLDVEDGSLVVRIKGKDALYCLCRTLRVPVGLVKGVAASPRRLVPATGLRLPGTAIPGVLRAGSYGTGASRDFWLVRRAKHVLVIELEAGAPYRRIVLEVADPNAEAVRLRPLVGAYTGTFDAR
ncbi:MAG TPA: hypothetical protein VNA30_02735 [Mycobacteriales bacterium]|nr:hypothetical protein [Mycobacteriales bacterium]